MRLPQLRSRPPQRHAGPWYRRITGGHVVLAVGVVLGLLLVVFAFQASQASSSLRLASNQAEVLQTQIVSGAGEAASLGGRMKDAQFIPVHGSGSLRDGRRALSLIYSAAFATVSSLAR